MKEMTIKGWVARDENGELWVYDNKPVRGDGIWSTYDGYMRIPEDIPDITWKGGLKEAEITIKIKE